MCVHFKISSTPLILKCVFYKNHVYPKYECVCACTSMILYQQQYRFTTEIKSIKFPKRRKANLFFESYKKADKIDYFWVWRPCLFKFSTLRNRRNWHLNHNNSRNNFGILLVLRLCYRVIHLIENTKIIDFIHPCFWISFHARYRK